MLSHDQIWAAIDSLAARYGMSASGLAKKAGLDPTTFNKSKRVSPDGRQRWPSTESVAKVLEATGASLDEFMSLISPRDVQYTSRAIPLLGFAQAGAGGFFDDGGFPVGRGWDEVEFPDLRRFPRLRAGGQWRQHEAAVPARRRDHLLPHHRRPARGPRGREDQ